MIKSLVTGGAGFIGSHIVDKLLNAGHSVICLDNEFADNEIFFWNDKAQNIKGDIRDANLLSGLLPGVDYVFHCAAESRIVPAIKNPLNTLDINVLGTANLLQCSREAGVKRVIFSSTSSAYGLNPVPNVETQPEDCLNPYSVSKVSAEKICSMYSNLYGLQTIIFRYFNVYGERAPRKGQYCPVIGIFLRQKEAGESLTIVGDGNQRRDFVYVGDVANANLIAATKEISSNHFGQVYNVGNGYNISINEIAKSISDDFIYVPSREGEAFENLADITKFKSTFHWEPQMTVENWIAKQI
ncbi:NAD-dependent epimerase/dehydratase family protein [Prochlorococcus sp. MIT 1341]|uniref:NAD-dependent epimerase/dehydratase family protein n=1 Tax=Prochlorococcus sp. MIT 1341 TaxID=3096221 RepID=UPI002A7509FB|nr:NAD-dependent epimerase/dehydratase family protein [Prochlorococcus sp. MIT 1341]